MLYSLNGPEVSVSGLALGYATLSVTRIGVGASGLVVLCATVTMMRLEIGASGMALLFAALSVNVCRILS